jgi:hypothetical protein
MSRRMRLMRACLWVSVLAWGIGVGTKLYDLRVVAGAWSAAPPQSLTLLPYGSHFPVDPGKFFFPTSLCILVAAFGALIGGWKTPFRYRVWLWSSAVLILVVWVFTVVVFWPMNALLFAAASGAASEVTSETELIRLAHRWVTCDWWRVVMNTRIRFRRAGDQYSRPPAKRTGVCFNPAQVIAGLSESGNK